MDDELKAIAENVAHWAAAKREIGEVWFFGSRVRGTHRSDSDLDIAIVMINPQRSKGDRYGDWVFLSDDWESELIELVKLKIDLDIGDQDIAVNVVAPALKREGVRVYRLGSPSPLRGGARGGGTAGGGLLNLNRNS